MRVRLVLLAAAWAAIPAGLQAGASKPAPVSIRLLAEGNEKDGESFVSPVEILGMQKKIFVKKVPVLTEKDIRTFFPFPGQDGMAGAYFMLGPHGADKFEQFTTEDRGKIAVVMVNGRVAGALQVDKRVTDGILFVPGGILPNEIALLHQKYPMMGREAEFGKKPPKAKAQ